MTDHIPLTGKIVLVTGGSRGIGAAIVRRLAREGASVAFTYVSAAEKAQALVADLGAQQLEAFAIRADSASTTDIQAAVDATVAKYGRLDILVNNAGIMIGGSLLDYPLEKFDEMVATNVRAIFLAVKAAVPHMKPGARIIVIGSNTASRATPNAAVYIMTKSAVAGLVRGLAHDLGPMGISVSNVQPGPVETDMIRDGDERSARLKPLIPMRRLGRGEEIAGLVSYLSGPDGGFVNGAALTVDGGYAA